MAKNIQIVKRNTVELPGISSYMLTLAAINAENMPTKIFVKQRIRNFAKGTIDDVFAAVCTPAQLEDFPEDAPEPGSSYYRTDTIEIVVRTLEMLQTAADSIIYEVKKLTLDLEALEELSRPLLYNVNPLEELTETVELTEPNIAALTTAQVNLLSKYEISALSTSQIAAFNTEQIKVMYPSQIEAFTAKQIGALQTNLISVFSPTQIKAITPSAIAALQPAQLASLSVLQVDSLNPIQIAALTGKQAAAISTNAIPTLTTAQIAALTPTAVAGMTSDKIVVLTTTQLAAMDPEDVAAIIPPAINSLNTVQVNAFTTKELAAFTPTQAAALTTTQKNSLSAQKLSVLPQATQPVTPAPATLWLPATAVGGNVPEIVNLTDFATNYVRANIGNAASWIIAPYEYMFNGVLQRDNEGVKFTINNVTKTTSKAVLTLIYKNNGADPTRPGKDANGYQRPCMYIRNLTGSINGTFRILWNNVQILSRGTGSLPTGVFDYFPDSVENFGAAGKLAANQSTAFVIEIEATGSATTITGELFLGYFV